MLKNLRRRCLEVIENLTLYSSSGRSLDKMKSPIISLIFTKKLIISIFFHSRYYKSVDEVLTSVQKTEESLRRLKNLREKSQQSSANPSDKQLMSDDDKIRLQLQIDILYYVKYIEGHQLKKEEIDSLVTLVNLIGDITKMKISVA